jgi:hypothetical protein
MSGNTTKRYKAVLPPPLWPICAVQDATHVPFPRPCLRVVCSVPRTRRPHSVAVSASTGSGSQNTETRPKKCDKDIYSQVCRRPRLLPFQLLQRPLIDSWELGALAEALIEYEWPELAVFTSGSIPPSTQLNGLGTDVVSIAEKCVFFPFSSFPAAGVDACLLVGD